MNEIQKTPEELQPTSQLVLIIKTKKHGEVCLVNPFFQYDPDPFDGIFRLGMKCSHPPTSLQAKITFALFCQQASEIWAIMEAGTYIFKNLELLAAGDRDPGSIHVQDGEHWFSAWQKDPRVGASWTSTTGPEIHSDATRRGFMGLADQLDLLGDGGKEA